MLDVFHRDQDSNKGQRRHCIGGVVVDSRVVERLCRSAPRRSVERLRDNGIDLDYPGA